MPCTSNQGHPSVIRITLSYLFRVSAALEPIISLKVGDSYPLTFMKIFEAHTEIDAFLNNSVFAATLRSCRNSDNLLINGLIAIMQNKKFDRELDFHEIYPVTTQAPQFKTELLAELGVLPAYFVSQKESFDTITLLDDGVKLFPSELSNKVPEALFDIAEAGKALAYEIPTACGFHIFRATESVLRKYYSHSTGGSPPPKVRNIGVYVRMLRAQNCGDEIVLATLQQLARLHRNPLIHPEAVLTMDEAIATLGIARSVVTAMLKILPVVLPTTGAA